MMYLKSNLDDRKRLAIADKVIDNAENMIENKHNYVNNDVQGQFKTTTFTPKQMNKLDSYLLNAMMAIEVMKSQASGSSKSKHIHYVHFPNQNKQFREILGNHQVARILNIDVSKPNEITLYLAPKEKARKRILDVLNYRPNKFN